MNPLHAALLVAFCAASLSVVAADDSLGAGIAATHWLSRAELPAARRTRIPSWCEGLYVERQRPVALGVDPGALPLHGRARRVSHSVGGLVILDGAVVLEQGNRRLTGERATVTELDHQAHQVELSGGVTLTEPGLALAATTAEFSDRAGRAEEVEFLLFGPGFRGSADVVERAGETTRLLGARFTRCEPGTATWELETRELGLREGAEALQVRGATLKLRGVPILRVPRLRLPVSDERQSGFLPPDVTWSRDEGLDLSVPYYFNLHPQYDATVTPRYVAERGAGLELQARGLTGSAEAAVGVAMLPDDAMYAEDTGEDDNDRWLATVEHRGRFGPLSTTIDYTAASDVDYLRDLGSDLGVARRSFLTRFATARFDNGGWSAGISGLGFQWLAPRTDPYRRLPEIDLSYVGGSTGAFNWAIDSVWTAFDAPAERGAAVDGRRLHIEPRVSLPFVKPWGFLKFGAGYRYTAYDLDGVAASRNPNPERRIAFGDIDAGLFLERGATLGGATFVQTLEPRAYYLRQGFTEQDHLPRFDPSVTPFSFQQLFRRNRFAGLDRISDADQLALAVTSRMLDAATGAERLAASVGTVVHFEDRRVSLGEGLPPPQADLPLVAELAARVGYFRASAAVTWDTDRGHADEVGLALQYRRDNRRIVNFGHRLRRAGAIDQSDASLIWPLSDRWAAIARFAYDFEQDRANEVFAGFEYATCCWQARAIYRRYVEAQTGLLGDAAEERGILLQFVFRGLAGFGSVESNLARGIKGYREESYADR